MGALSSGPGFLGALAAVREASLKANAYDAWSRMMAPEEFDRRMDTRRSTMRRSRSRSLWRYRWTAATAAWSFILGAAFWATLGN